MSLPCLALHLHRLQQGLPREHIHEGVCPVTVPLGSGSTLPSTEAPARFRQVCISLSQTAGNSAMCGIPDLFGTSFLFSSPWGIVL